MKLNKCKRGHFWDADRFSECNICAREDGRELCDNSNSTEKIMPPNILGFIRSPEDNGFCAEDPIAIRLVKCRNGHVFNSVHHDKCPICFDEKDRKIKLIKCEKGHIYNGAQHDKCPHCSMKEEFILKKVPENEQCPTDKHNFVSAGRCYRCEKCGLEVRRGGVNIDIYRDYYGSYIDGISHRWDFTSMSVSDIVEIEIKFGDCPIITVIYDGEKFIIKKSMNGSRDGWKSFPESFFDGEEKILSQYEKIRLFNCLSSMDFNKFITNSRTFDNLFAPGFCLYEKFFCRFSNGRGFECLLPSNEDFNMLVSVIKEIIGLQSMVTQTNKVKEEPVSGIVVPCCGKKIPDSYTFCPYCGALLKDKENFQRCDIIRDPGETISFCYNCGSDMRFEHKFCGKCGARSPWRH